jgi:hypothetical protein
MLESLLLKLKIARAVNTVALAFSNWDSGKKKKSLEKDGWVG